MRTRTKEAEEDNELFCWVFWKWLEKLYKTNRRFQCTNIASQNYTWQDERQWKKVIQYNSNYGQVYNSKQTTAQSNTKWRTSKKIDLNKGIRARAGRSNVNSTNDMTEVEKTITTNMTDSELCKRSSTDYKKQMKLREDIAGSFKRN